MDRRSLLQAAAMAPLALALGACGDGDGEDPGGSGGASTAARATPDAGAPLTPTPACDDGDEPTAEQTEGPYFTPGSPERRDISGGERGTPLLVTGLVVTTDCRPVPRALLDFWQADDGGAYDNEGFRLRGHQFTDDRGRFRLVTVMPGLYPGRTRHIHVKVQRPRGEVLTTQLYFPGEDGNAADAIYDPALEMALGTSSGRRAGRFDFVLA